MRIFSRAIPAGRLLPLILVAGVTGLLFAKHDTLSAEAKASSDSVEVSVIIKIPTDEPLTGTAIITLEDISFQDAPSVEIARLEVPASSLTADLADNPADDPADDPVSVAVPVDLQAIDSSADINVAVLIDSDDSGDVSAGDWISNSLALVITNHKMETTVDVVRINPP